MKYTFLILALLFAAPAVSCDMCNYYIGLDPGYNKNTIGFRTNYQKLSLSIPDHSGLKTFHTNHGGGSEESNNTIDQNFLGFELFARIYPIKKAQIIVSLPYQMNTITAGDQQESRSALSDLTLLGFYQILNLRAGDSSRVQHRLFGGLGVKFPTGKSSGASDIDIPLAYDLYSGTGSTDYMIALSYIGKYKKLGWHAEVNYKLNGESKNEYKYGNSFNWTPTFYYETKIKSLTILPHLGGSLEVGSKDEYFQVKQDVSGGTIGWASGGVDFYFKRFSITTDARIPVFHDTPDELPESKYWLFSSLNFHF